MNRLLSETFWPSRAGEAPLTVATRRLLSVFLVIAGLGLLGVSAAYFQKNVAAHPWHSFGVLACAFVCLVLPVWTARTPRPERAALVILVAFFAVNTALGSGIDGLISIKALVMLPLAVATTLVFGWQAGILSGLFSGAVFLLWHIFRDRIGGNLATPPSPGDLSAMLLIGLTFVLALMVAGTSIYRQQLLRIVGLLGEARREAELASRAKSVLLATVSHELRAPMSGITGLANTLLGTKLDPDQRGMVENVRQSGETLERLLNDLLDHAAMQSGKLELRREQIELGRLLDRVVAPFIVESAAKGVAFESDIQTSVRAHFVGDPVRIGQVIANLAANAVKFTAKGKIRLSAAIESRANGSPATTLLVSIADTGVGIPHDAQHRVFEAFEQVHAETATRLGGVGLGLSICRGLVDRMGGSIDLISQPGAGSTFLVRIPVETAPCVSASPHAAASPEPATGLASKRVLMIEDNYANQKILEVVLESFAIDVVVAGYGAEGIRQALEGDFDAALIDINLPDMDGISVCRTVAERRAALGLARMPVLMITADGTAARTAEAEHAGADGLLSKPISPETLFSRLSTMMLDGAGGGAAARSLLAASP